MDDTLDHVHIEWLQRLKRREVTCEEALGVLPGLKTRLEFLRNLHSRIAGDSKFADQARDVERKIQNQTDEISIVEEYIRQGTETK